MREVQIVVCLIVGIVISVSACEQLVCVSNSQETCLSFASQITMNTVECAKCRVILHTIINSKGQFIPEGLRLYEKCLNSPLINSHNVANEKYNGEDCTVNQECASRQCDSILHICSGKELGQQCADDLSSNCGENLTCIKGQCVKFTVLSSECTSTLECDSSSFCNEGKCRKYGSLQNGEKVTENEMEIQAIQIDLRCQGLLIDPKGQCTDLSEQMPISSSKEGEICEIFQPSESETDQSDQHVPHRENRAISNDIQQELKKLRRLILQKNVLCPPSIKFSEDCHLIASEISRYREFQLIYSQLPLISKMPKCLKDVLEYDYIVRLFIPADRTKQNRIGYIVVFAVILLFIAMTVGGFYLLRTVQSSRKKHTLLELPQSNSLKQNDLLSLELNFTPSHREKAELDNSGLQDSPNKKKSKHREATLVENHLFSIDGDHHNDEDEELPDTNQNKINQPTIKEQETTHLSFENVFNLEGDPIQKPSPRRKRQSKKKIIKNDTENKYKVVEE